jgi:hypothetical protein
MFSYLDEHAFRFNNREGDDRDRFDVAVRGILDKRLTYKALTGKIHVRVFQRALTVEGVAETEARDAMKGKGRIVYR